MEIISKMAPNAHFCWVQQPVPLFKKKKNLRLSPLEIGAGLRLKWVRQPSSPPTPQLPSGCRTHDRMTAIEYVNEC